MKKISWAIIQIIILNLFILDAIELKYKTKQELYESLKLYGDNEDLNKDDKELLLQKDKAFILELLKEENIYCNFFKNIDKRLQKDREVALLAVEKGHIPFENLDSSLKKDKSFILELLHSDKFYIFDYLDESFKNDKEILSLALKGGYGLEYTTNEQQSNRTFVMKMIQRNPHAFKVAREMFRDDREVALLAIVQSSDNLGYVGKKLKKDPKFILTAMKSNSCMFIDIDKSLKNDKKFLLKLVKVRPIILVEVDSPLQNDKSLVIEALKVEPTIFSYLQDEIKKDKEILDFMENIKYFQK